MEIRKRMYIAKYNKKEMLMKLKRFMNLGTTARALIIRKRLLHERWCMHFDLMIISFLAKRNAWGSPLLTQVFHFVKG